MGPRIATPDWSQAAPAPGPVLVVRVRHDRPPPPHLAALIAPAERVRCERFRLAADRARCRWARILARAVLGRVLGLAPPELRFAVGPHGKPSVAGVEFSLSHGGDWVLLAAGARPVGIDVEPLHEPALAAELGHRVLAADEAAWVDGDPGPRFTALWTRKEALLKRDGAGLVDDLAGVGVLAEQPGLVSFAMPGHVGALACDPGTGVAFCEAEALI